MPTRLTWWRLLDGAAHLLYMPTMFGRRSTRIRWHHRIHLIPRPLFARVCDAAEDFYLGGSDD